jgi:hypothetical protein
MGDFFDTIVLTICQKNQKDQKIGCYGSVENTRMKTEFDYIFKTYEIVRLA